MSLKDETISLSKLYGIKPTSNRGQNFLIDEATYQDIISAAKITDDETVLEVGPGLGFLTMHLARVAKKVITVELDKKLFDALQNRLHIEKIKNVDSSNADIMNFSLPWAKKVSEIKNNNLVVVANLPYTITSIFLRFFVGGNIANIIPARFILMLQKEVAERIAAPAGQLSKLAISVQLHCDVHIVKIVSRKMFWPAPDVDSAVIELTRNNHWLDQLQAIGKTDEQLMRLVRIGFSAKRKMLKANLSAGYKTPVDKILEYFRKVGIAENVRAQELSLDQWIKLLPFLE